VDTDLLPSSKFDAVDVAGGEGGLLVDADELWKKELKSIFGKGAFVAVEAVPLI